MKFYVIGDRELGKGLAVAKTKHGILLDKDALAFYAGKIQEYRANHRMSFEDARGYVLKDQITSDTFPALKCALGALYAERKKIRLEEAAAIRTAQQREIFLEDLNRLYWEDFLSNPQALPIDPDAELCANEEPWAAYT